MLKNHRPIGDIKTLSLLTSIHYVRCHFLAKAVMFLGNQIKGLGSTMEL